MSFEEDDFECEISLNEGSSVVESSSNFETTILRMENDGTCLHPTHGHSFQAVHFFTLGGGKCAGCDQRLQVFGGVPQVKCVACGALAHRSCALGSETVWTPSNVCSVNHQIVSSLSPNVSFEAIESDQVPPLASQRRPPEECWSKVGVQQQHSPSQQQQQQQRLSMIPTLAIPESTSHDEGDGDDDDEDKDQVHLTPLHYANHPFASVSRALQENIAAHFLRTESSTALTTTTTVIPPQPTAGMDPTTQVVAASLAATASAPPQQSPATNRFFQLADRTLEAVRSNLSRPVALAGGIVGGLSGLVVAGPAGSYAGYQMGGALGVILEGSVSIGVFVASVATGGYTASQIQDHLAEKRILTFGEDGTSRKVLLVRPNIKIDRHWEQIWTEARRNAPGQVSGFAILPSASTHERYRRDSDIVKVDEDEISTNDKVLLLVSRLVSDKTSLPGYVYRYLIDAFFHRCEERQRVLESNTSIASLSTRARRDDVHAVIKYVTAALLEVRPRLASTATVTEMTATAVEGLVFAKLYDAVMEEIVIETGAHDEALRAKIRAHEQEGHDFSETSEAALKALTMLPQAQSAVDKLYYCVEFLNELSDFHAGTVCADSLLKLACQHMVVVKEIDWNAQVAFLEEFARDEQLLRGREGYSLVTLQASLHFLNLCDDLQQVFEADEDEENVPMEDLSVSHEEEEETLIEEENEDEE